MLAQVTEILSNSPDLIEEIVLGGIRPAAVPYLQIETWTSREGISNNVHIEMVVAVESNRIPKGRPWAKGDTKYRQRKTLPGSKFGQLNDDECQSMILETFATLARSLSTHLYELDPRIGLPINAKFPVSPLFDPPAIQEMPEGWSPWYDNFIEGVLTNNTPSAPPSTLQWCPFCLISVMTEDPAKAVWGGGNIGWVHLSCAPWVGRKTP